MDYGKVSVIVPIYKAESYLDRCIQSIVDQTYTNLEIILVDDGSPDNCPAICDAWAEKDSRVQVIHKENGGVSTARNAGISIARGVFLHLLIRMIGLRATCLNSFCTTCLNLRRTSVDALFPRIFQMVKLLM